MNMDLIQCLDPRWRWEGEYEGTKYIGIAEKFAVGPAHPRYDEFERILALNPPSLRPARRVEVERAA